MASSWKLTKKLKETNFLRGHVPSTDETNHGNEKSPTRSGVRDTLVAAARPVDKNNEGSTYSALSSLDSKTYSPEESRTNTLTGHTLHAPSEKSKHRHTLSTTTSENPSLLRVKVYEIKHLPIPDKYAKEVPAWALDISSTRPPPVYLVLEYDKVQILLHAIGGTVEEPVWDKITTFDVAVDSKTPLSISLYLRLKEPGTSKVNDVGLGSILVSAADFNKQDQLSISGGKLSIKCELHNTKNQPLSIDDFTLLKVVGKGSFGKVMQVRKNDTRQIYALKTIRKAHIVSKSEIGHTLAERTVLAKINNPFIVPLKFSFQSPEKLYLVLAFVNGGELFHHLQREGPFDLNRARFYTAELLCALECLHEYNVIYRDLKPENILLDYTGHIALCDFGLCKLNMGTNDQTKTFCGTPEYLAPELLLGQGYTKAVDWWTLGVLFYEMLTGLPPFFDQDINTMYHKIVKDPLLFPADMDREAKSLITGLLERDPSKRLGVNGAAEIKAHPFFNQIDWKFLLNKKYAAPFLPLVASAVDTSNFDSEFTNEVPMDSVVEKASILSESVQDQFKGWSYSNESRLASSGKW